MTRGAGRRPQDALDAGRAAAADAGVAAGSPAGAAAAQPGQDAAAGPASRRLARARSIWPSRAAVAAAGARCACRRPRRRRAARRIRQAHRVAAAQRRGARVPVGVRRAGAADGEQPAGGRGDRRVDRRGVRRRARRRLARGARARDGPPACGWRRRATRLAAQRIAAFEKSYDERQADRWPSRPGGRAAKARSPRRRRAGWRTASCWRRTATGRRCSTWRSRSGTAGR